MFPLMIYVLLVVRPTVNWTISIRNVTSVSKSTETRSFPLTSKSKAGIQFQLVATSKSFTLILAMSLFGIDWPFREKTIPGESDRSVRAILYLAIHIRRVILCISHLFMYTAREKKRQNWIGIHSRSSTKTRRSIKTLATDSHLLRSLPSNNRHTGEQLAGPMAGNSLSLAFRFCTITTANMHTAQARRNFSGVPGMYAHGLLTLHPALA